MWTVVLALLPPLIASIYFFGWNAVRVIVVALASCLATEVLTQKLLRKRTRITDGSALLTGILFAFLLPSTVSTEVVVYGSVFSVLVGKELFGGLGYNVFNPAQAGRAFLLDVFPLELTTWALPHDVVTTATPLTLVKEQVMQLPPTLLDLLLGNIAGSLGETCKIAVLLGGLFLLMRRIIPWEMPVVHLLTAFVVSVAFKRDPVYELLSGGVLLAAFFYITNIVTCPVTRLGRILFASGSTGITMVIRIWGGYPEGETYGILIMNAVTPVIDRFIRPRILGEKRGR
jgi:electron transport complex protein RnfD